MSKRDDVRTVALAVVRRRSDGAILLGIGTDPATRRQFCRPVGGRIEKGETPEEAVRREYIEEVGLALDDVRPLAVLDNRYVYGGERRREVAHLFEAHLADRTQEARGEFPVEKKSLPKIARWFRPEHLGPEAANVVPEGLWDRLRPVRQTPGPVRCIVVVPGGGRRKGSGSATLAAAANGKVLRLEEVNPAEGLLELLAAEVRSDPEFVAGFELHRDLPGLEALRRAGFAVWGSDPPRLPRVLEIDPQELEATVTAAERHDAMRVSTTKRPGSRTVVRFHSSGSADSRVAAGAALTMDRHRAELLSLPTAADDVERLEGRIWRPWS